MYAAVVAAGLAGCAVDEPGSGDDVDATDDQAAAAARADELDTAALGGDEVLQKLALEAENTTASRPWYHDEVLLEYHGPPPGGMSSYEAAICKQKGYHSALFPHTNRTPFRVLNGCYTRVWMYQWRHTPICVSRGAAVNIPPGYTSFLLSLNPNPC
jgi:hypothetical protein